VQKLPNVRAYKQYGVGEYDGVTVSWTYKTEIPHAKFRVYKDNEIYCIGMVFDICSESQ
jgi:hypothetical protein